MINTAKKMGKYWCHDYDPQQAHVWVFHQIRANTTIRMWVNNTTRVWHFSKSTEITNKGVWVSVSTEVRSAITSTWSRNQGKS